MKIEVQFVSGSVDVDTYEGEHINWVFGEGLLVVFSGASKDSAVKVASYPEGRVVRVRVIETP